MSVESRVRERGGGTLKIGCRLMGKRGGTMRTAETGRRFGERRVRGDGQGRRWERGARETMGERGREMAVKVETKEQGVIEGREGDGYQ